MEEDRRTTWTILLKTSSSFPLTLKGAVGGKLYPACTLCTISGRSVTRTSPPQPRLNVIQQSTTPKSSLRHNQALVKINTCAIKPSILTKYIALRLPLTSVPEHDLYLSIDDLSDRTPYSDQCTL